jgi:hypothetical protein
LSFVRKNMFFDRCHNDPARANDSSPLLPFKKAGSIIGPTTIAREIPAALGDIAFRSACCDQKNAPVRTPTPV